MNAKADSLFKVYARAVVPRFSNENPYYIIGWREAVSSNMKIVRHLDEKLAIVQLDNQEMLDFLRQNAIIAEAKNEWKFSPLAERLILHQKKEQSFIISASHIDSLLSLLKSMGDHLNIISINRPSHSILIKATAKFVKTKLLSAKEVIFIDVRANPHTEISIIGYNRSFNGINTVDYSIPAANGKNIVAGVKEQNMDENDLDLYKRVLSSPIASANTTNHATVIASIMGGAGNSFYDGRGIANGCDFFSSSFDDLFADDAAILNSNKVTVQNHSYGTIIQQFYGAEAVSYDEQAWKNKHIVHVFSAGNEGTGFATDGRYANISGYANLTGNFKMAKNIITTGAIDNKETIPAESSSGPLYDGRLAPQLIALGPNGTSDAAAIVSGTIAVMQQVYKDSNQQSLPPASLIKALLYNTAEDVYSKAIDYKTGYGLLNSYEAIRSLQQKKYDGAVLAQGQLWTTTLTVPQNSAQLKVTLAWTDSAASVNNDTKALLNDLDLEVQELNTGIVYKPWVLNTSPHADSLSKLPKRKRDSLNTAEQVSIQLPAAGVYSVRVKGILVSTTSIPFHIAYHADTLNTFAFTSPQHASDVNIQENTDVFIRWKTFVTDTNQTGNLYISYDKGTGWQLIQQSCRLYNNKFQWQVKDTSSRAILKMETAFGSFLSQEFIIGKVIRLSVDFVCADSFRLSWNKHIYADAYKVYTLTDSPYLQPLLTLSDTFIVMKRSFYPQLVYAIEPILNNNLSAARSIAIDINLQGVKCFYKTFYYNLQTENALELVLELSTPEYADSIFFEQVTATGQLVKTYDGIKTNSSTIYRHLINDAPAGTSYWRTAIKLKNGTATYTEIISVLTSGKRYILFYPNPVNRNGFLQYVLQQDLPPGSKLSFFDVTGRLLKNYNDIPANIDFRSITPGLIVYKLFSSNNNLLETGKLVIQ